MRVEAVRLTVKVRQGQEAVNGFEANMRGGETRRRGSAGIRRGGETNR